MSNDHRTSGDEDPSDGSFDNRIHENSFSLSENPTLSYPFCYDYDIYLNPQNSQEIWDYFEQDLFINHDYFGQGNVNDGVLFDNLMSYAKDNFISNQQFELSDDFEAANVLATEDNPRHDHVFHLCKDIYEAPPQVPSTRNPGIYLANRYEEKELIGSRFASSSSANNNVSASNNQLELGYLPDNLDIAKLSTNKEKTKLRETNEVLRTTSTSDHPLKYLGKDECNHPKLVQKQGKILPTHKPRISWSTPELHNLFIDAVNKLNGPEHATPKNILRLMNVEGLNIDQVKSHLQKYRNTMHVQKLKRAEAVAPSFSDDQSGTLFEEALRLQMGLQKKLHEHLMEQKELQLRIEKQGDYLKEILNRRQKSAGSTSMMNNSEPSLIPQEDKSDYGSNNSDVLKCRKRGRPER